MMQNRIDLTADQMEKQVSVWLKKKDEVILSLPSRAQEITINLRSGPDLLYDYYPFLANFYINGDLECCAEFDGPDEILQIRLPVESPRYRMKLSVVTELGGRPSERGGGADGRELAVHLERVTCHTTPQLAMRARSTAHEKFIHHTGPLAGELPRPVFVIGCYRSGTSAATWTIGQHPNIAPLEETNWLPMLYYGTMASHRIAAGRGKDSASQIYEVPKESFLNWQGQAVDVLHERIVRYFASRIDLQRHSNKAPNYDPRFQVGRTRFAPKARWVDGTPENTSIAIGLSGMFPGARFIFMLRQPERVICSLMRFDQIGGRRHSFTDAVAAWETKSKHAYEAHQRLGRSVVFLTPHERLANDRDRLIDDWFAFLDEPRFPKAAKTLDQVINSSGDGTTEFSPDELLEIERLNALYEGMVGGDPLQILPWKTPLDSFESRENDVVTRVMSCITNT